MTDKTERNAAIAELVNILIKDYQPKKIFLFGSYAKGNTTEDSDIDLLIIKNTETSPLDRWVEVKRLLRKISKKYPISPLVYTEKEIEERLAIKDFFINEILEEGQMLYG